MSHEAEADSNRISTSFRARHAINKKTAWSGGNYVDQHGRGVDLYTFGWALGPPILISAPNDALALLPQSLYLLVGAPDAESGF